MATTYTKYKGFDIEFSITRNGFNQYRIIIKKYRNKGTRREEYFSHYINTFHSYKKDAMREAKEYIDGLDASKIQWASQGLMNATWLPK